MSVLKVTPDKIKESTATLAELSTDIQCVVNKCKLLLENMNSQWEGEGQKEFEVYAYKIMNDMTQFAYACNEYAHDINEIAKAYSEAESSFANNISSNFFG